MQVNDFERLNGELFLSTSDGKVMSATEPIWQFSCDLGQLPSGQLPGGFNVMRRGNPSASIQGGQLSISASLGDVLMYRQEE